jgi:general transcriptional corepressor CYC8
MLDFDKSNEVLFRLGIIYKQQTKYDESLGCFDRILRNPPSPLANADIWFQIGHVYEQQGDVRVGLLRFRPRLIHHLAHSCSGSL